MVYFDNAATTFPKPTRVIDEVSRCMTLYGGNPGRGAYTLSMRAAEKVYACRELAAEMFGASNDDRVFFTPNTTYGINAVLKGLLKQGDHVIVSDLEHNAVSRPIYKLAEQGVIEYDMFRTGVGTDEMSPQLICSEINKLIRPNTRAVVCTHASNICSAVLPIEDIGQLCRLHGLYLIVDGAQSAGHEHIDVRKMNISALCLPGHKGLYGPQGSGFVVLGDGVVLDTLVEGGNGIASLELCMPTETPERYEAGTVATPCIAGLCEGLKFVRRCGLDEIAYNQRKICRRMCELLGNMRGVTLYAPEYCGSIVLFNVDGIPSEVVAAELDRQGVCVRGGHHCAAFAHKTLCTPEDGAVRASFGVFNNIYEADKMAQVIEHLI